MKESVNRSNQRTSWRRSLSRVLYLALALLTTVELSEAAPTVTRLTPPSLLFRNGDPDPPYISRFLPGQRFDLQATVSPDAGHSIAEVRFLVDGAQVDGTVSFTPATVDGKPQNTVVVSVRAYANKAPGAHTVSVVAVQSDGQTATAQGNFEIFPLTPNGRGAKNLIILIGDGMGIAHRTAARIMLNGVSLGKANTLLSMDTFPFTASVITHSLNSIVTDSSPGASCYATGNKANNNQHGVFPDDTRDSFDNPRVESIGEYLHRTEGRSLGLVTTADVFDSTPAAFGSHTQARSAATGIVDQYFDERKSLGLTVLMGGGRKWFLPNNVTGSARKADTDYVLPAEVANAWAVPAGAIDPGRDLIADFIAAGYTYVGDNAALKAVPAGTSKLLGLFASSNMSVAKDKLDKRRNPAGLGIVDDHGFPDQPMLDEMTERALQVLSQDPNGFVAMIEGASIDKQAHLMDAERWIIDTIEFDRAVEVCRQFAEDNPDTLVIVTADHECAGAHVIGSSKVKHADLVTRAALGVGADQLRKDVVGTLEAAGFPNYPAAPDGYPATTDIDFRMLVGYACNADRYEDWITNPQPTQHPAHGVVMDAPHPKDPLNRDTAGNFLVTGHIPALIATHTASDILLSAFGKGAPLFRGVMDNTDVFFKVMQAALGDTGLQARFSADANGDGVLNISDPIYILRYLFTDGPEPHS